MPDHRMRRPRFPIRANLTLLAFTFREIEMIIDFHHHYTPPELMERGKDGTTVRLDENGNPNYRFNAELADLPAHVRMMDKAGIDVAVLSCGEGFDQPNLATCRLINDRMHQAERDHPGRFVGLAHVPALNPQEAALELKRCAVELGFPGVVIASEVQGQSLDASSLRPFWKAAADLGLYVFIHPLPRVISWGADGGGRPRPDARLGILPDGGDGAAHQQRSSRRASFLKYSDLTFCRWHRPISPTHSRAPAAGEKRHRFNSAA